MTSVLTASDLRVGEPVFWDGDRWVGRFAEAWRFDDEASAQGALEASRGQATIVVDPYLVEIEMDGDVAVPVSFRERIRALGPTIHPDMGKQAEGGSVVAVLRAHAGGGRSSGRLGLIRRK